MRLLPLSVCLVGLLSANAVARAETGFLDRTVTVKGREYRYQVYVPLEHTKSKKWPVIVSLHGNGSQGNDGLQQTASSMPTAIRANRSA
jgi:predicted peptidase